MLVRTNIRWVTNKLKEELKNFPSLIKSTVLARVNAKRRDINLNFV